MKTYLVYDMVEVVTSVTHNFDRSLRVEKETIRSSLVEVTDDPTYYLDNKDYIVEEIEIQISLSLLTSHDIDQLKGLKAEKSLGEMTAAEFLEKNDDIH